MNIHKLPRLTPFRREALVQRVRAGVPVAVVAREADALQDRAPTPHHSPNRLPRYRRRQTEKRRRQRWSSRRIAQ
jgi:hypothetical protein